MPKFMCTHTLPPNSLTRQQVDEVTQAAQRDPIIRGYRSFLNASEGKVICIMEGPSREAVANWFQKMGLPWDDICAVEMEGDRGRMTDLRSQPTTATAPGASAHAAGA